MCKRPAGYGTDHPGVGRCKQHGGNSPSGIKSAAVIIGEGSILTGKTVMGIPVEMDPADALTKCIAIAAGEVAYCTAQIMQLNELKDEMYEQDHLGRRQLHLWIRERRGCIDRLAKLSKMALDAGVAERQVQLAEQQADLIIAVIDAMVEELGLKPDQMQKALPQVLVRLGSGAEVLDEALETRTAPSPPLG
jgi:hypothetical protein